MVKFLSKTSGKTLNSDKDFKKRLTHRGGITEVMSLEECDVIVVFCPIVSRAESDVKAAQKEIPDGKRAILIVLHHTFDPEYTVPDCSGHVTKSDVFTIHCLFHDSKGGLLQCPRNDRAVEETLRRLNVQPEDSSSLSFTSRCIGSICDSGSRCLENIRNMRNWSLPSICNIKNELSVGTPISVSAEPRVKVFSLEIGNTLNHHKGFMMHILANGGLQEVGSLQECDILITFCPIVSRAGTDIEAALQQIPAGKPAILVVLHHTFDPECTVPESKRHVPESTVLLTVDVLFYENMGLLNCHRNDSAIKTVIATLEMNRKPKEPAQAVEEGRETDSTPIDEDVIEEDYVMVDGCYGRADWLSFDD